MTANSKLPICFVAAPFLPEHQPALGVSSLAAVLNLAGISNEIVYFNIDYAQYAGQELNAFIASANPADFLVGEMVFSTALWGEKASKWELYRDRVIEAWQDPAYRHRQPKNLRSLLDGVRRLQENAPKVVERWANEVLRKRPRVVGFTTTFQQNIASLALAKELRSRVDQDELAIVFGGSNCEGAMGESLARAFPFINHVVSGEGENIIVDIVNAYTGGGGKRGEILRSQRCISGTMVLNMDSLPIPDCDAYFEQIKGTDIEPKANLVAESSRGCWWGTKSHCTFCGLNGQTVHYRSKAPTRFMEELRILRKKHGLRYFTMADNILDMEYIKTVFTEFASEDEDFNLFYEVKANLRKEQLEILAAGGMIRIQPGIESLSSSILALMNKGTTLLQNVQLLKWCEEFKIEAAWNLLYGFPGEAPGEYEAMTAMIPSLIHLQAPLGTGRVRMDRFSPYWCSPERFEITNIRPQWSYDQVYSPLPATDRMDLAYYFDFDHPTLGDPYRYCTEMLGEVDRWRERIPKATLEIERMGTQVTLVDTRTMSDSNGPIILNDVEVAILKNLDGLRTRSGCVDAVATETQESRSIVEAAIDRGLDRKWLISEGDKLLSLVVDRNEFQRVVNTRAALQMQRLGLLVNQ